MGITRYAADPAVNTGTLVVLAHGAGAGQTHPFMVRYARGLSERGMDVVTFNFPYIEARRRAPDKRPVLEAAFRDAVREAVRGRLTAPAHLIIGGKSMGGRIATYLAADRHNWPADLPPLGGVIALGYPLNPPGGAGRQDRVSHLLEITAPVLIVQGTRDSFGSPDDIRASLARNLPNFTIHPVEGGDHSFTVRKSLGRPQADVDRDILDAIRDWVSLQRTASGA
jgi:predicted alpha/beta-hydrolase family hydrolase